MIEEQANCNVHHSSCCSARCCMRIVCSIILAIVALTYVATSYFTYRDTQATKAQGQVWMDNHPVQEKIREQKTAFSDINSKISDIRYLSKELQLTCQAHPNTISDADELLKYSMARWKAGIALMTSTALANTVYPEEVTKALISFNSWEISFSPQNLCEGKGPSDDEYAQKQTEIERMIEGAIRLNEQKLK